MRSRLPAGRRPRIRRHAGGAEQGVCTWATNPLDIASHGPVIPVIVIERLQDVLPLAEALLTGGRRCWR